MTLSVFPDAHVRRIRDRHLMTAVDGSRSPATGTQEIQDWGGEVWMFSIECRVSQGRTAREMSAFFDALGGRRTRFLFADPTAINPEGDVATLHRLPVVEGAGQTGNSLVTSGWDPGTWAMKWGDFFSLGSDVSTRLYRVTADAIADAAGNATLSITPRLRTSPADQEALEVTSPKVVLRMTSPIPTGIERADKHTFTFSAEEGL